MGPRTASSCCCQARNLPWAPVPPPHAAARSRVSHGSLYGLPLLLLSPSPHSAMCHFQVSSHTAGGFHFVIGCCMASHCCCLHRHCGSTLWFWPRDCPMSEVCGDSKIDGTHLHVILTDSIISLPQQTPRAFKLKYSVLH
ncbi:unnamed protein product [Staurois parvus]|uniref:Uncharacterized protein n=1 Tax=Staurois parvus TaxID=386267 RepID=A0ABN9EEY0_9NEOB|nr:unnamed protein product [Staurois parvus]